MADLAIMSRTDDLNRLYRILDRLEVLTGGKRFLAQLPLRELGREGVFISSLSRAKPVQAAVTARGSSV